MRGAATKLVLSSLCFSFLLVPGGTAEETQPGATASETETLTTTLDWSTIGAIFAARYAQRSPDQVNAKLAEDRYDASSRIFNPELTLRQATSALRSDTADSTYSTRSASLSQAFPFGTSISLARESGGGADPGTTSSGDIEDNQRTSLTLSQDLLKGGPWYGLSSLDEADRTYQRDLLASQVSYDKALYDVVSAFVAAQAAEESVAALTKALDRAATQNAAVKELVASGFRAKADTLVSDAQEVRAKLALQSGKATLAKAKRALANQLWQSHDDPPLVIAQSSPEPARVELLRSFPWPDALPEETLASLDLDTASAAARRIERDELPRLTADASLSRAGESGDGDESRTVSLTFSMPLVSGVTRDKANEARSLEVRSRATLDQVRLTARSTKTDRDEDIRQADEAVRAAEILRELAVNALAIEQQKYSDGKATVDQLRRSQDDMDLAEIDLIRRRSDLFLALLAKARDAGKIREAMIATPLNLEKP